MSSCGSQPFERSDDERPEVGGLDDVVHRPHLQRPPYVVNAVEIVGYLLELLGADHPDDVGKLVTQFGMSVGRIRRELSADARHPGIVLGPGADLAGEDSRGGRCAADHGLVRAGYRGGLHVLVEPFAEHDEGAAVVPGHDERRDGFRRTTYADRPKVYGRGRWSVAPAPLAGWTYQ